MQLRQIIVMAAVAVVVPAQAGELRPEQARQFVAGKHFAYNCFEGSSGAGRIGADGSVTGTIRIRGEGRTHSVSLPPGTIRVQSNSICAQVRGVPITPCFNVVQTDANSFRGSISGLGFAYCEFTRRNPRLHVADRPPTAQPTPTSSVAAAVEGE